MKGILVTGAFLLAAILINPEGGIAIRNSFDTMLLMFLVFISLERRK